MIPDEKGTFSEFPLLQGLWNPRPLDECREVLADFQTLPEIPVGILLLCLVGMRDPERWFAEGTARPKRDFTVLTLDQNEPPIRIDGGSLVRATWDIERGTGQITSWSDLLAATLWSEVRGAEVCCAWTAQAICMLQSAHAAEAAFFPWPSPVWQHGLVSGDHERLPFDSYEMALRRGLNPVLVGGLAGTTVSSATLNSSHFARARDLLRHGEAVARVSGSDANIWRLDRYYSLEATETTLGVAIDARRFRDCLFQWLCASNRDKDEHFLVVDALLHLRDRVPCRAVSCNSYQFRWRTRNPFLYQRLTLGELHQVLSFLDQEEDRLLVGYPAGRSQPGPSRSWMFIPGTAKNPVEVHRFQAGLDDGQIASGTLFRVPGDAIGRAVVPNIVAAQVPMRLSAIVSDYEKTSGARVLVAVNGGYFLDARTVPRNHPEWLGKPVGFLKCDNTVISGPFYTNRPLVCLDGNGTLTLRFVSQGLCSPENAPLDEAYRWSDDPGMYWEFRAAVEAGPLLINHGRKALCLDRERWGCLSARSVQAAPVQMPDLRTLRTAVCVARNGDLWLVTVHGRIPESAGMTHEEIANWLCRAIPDVDWAVEMDCGGSVTAWHTDAGVTTMGSCIGGHERPIATALLFSANG